MEGSTTYLQWLTADASDINMRLTGSNDGTNGVMTATSDYASNFMKGFSTDSTDNTSVATVAFVKNQLESIHPKDSAVGSSAVNVALTFQAGDTFDSRTLIADDRIVLIGQTNTAENGVWQVRTSLNPVRPDDFDVDGEVAGASIWVTDGAREGNNYVVTTPVVSTGFTLDTDPIALTASQSGTYTAGDGMALIGSEFSTDLKANGGLVIESGEIAVDLAASSITNQLAYSNLAALTTGQVIVGNGGTATAVTLQGDAAIIADGTLTIGSGAIDSGKIADLTIVNGDISASADIALSKLVAGSAAQIIVGAVTTGVPTYRTVTGDVSISNTGVTSIEADAVTLDMLEHGTGGDVLYYDASGVPTRLNKGTDGEVFTLVSGIPAWSAASDALDDGSVTLAKLDSFEQGSLVVGADVGGGEDPVLLAHGSANTILYSNGTTLAYGQITSDMITSSTIVNGDISASADIALSKLAAGSAAQIIVGAVATGVPTYRTVTGDVSISNTGVTSIEADAVTLDMLEHGTGGDVLYYDASGVPTRLNKGTDGEVFTLASGIPSWSAASSALDDGSVTLAKLAVGSAAQIIVGAATTGVPTYRTVTGDVSISNTGVTAITSGVIVDDDINASANITATKVNLATLTAGTGLDGTASSYNAQSTATISINANQTAIQTLYAADLAIGNASIEEKIVFNSTANEVEFYANNTLQNRVTDEDGTGKFYIRGNYQVFSDERIKGHVEDVDDALERIDQLSCKRYRLKRRDGTFGSRYEIGQVAQTTLKSCPELISTTEAEGYSDLHTVNYGGLAAIATEGVKSLHVKHNDAVAELRAENHFLREALAALTARVVALE
jgi:predicted SpoU family rRNA methylase